MKFAAELLENMNCIENRDGERCTAEELEVLESILRTRLRMETVPSSLGRAKSTFSNEEKKGIFEYCKDADTRLSVCLLECENNKSSVC